MSEGVGPQPLKLAASRGDRTAGAAFVAGIAVVLLGLAAVGWWWSARMEDDMTGGAMDGMGMHDPMSAGSFVLAWVAMMAAMMLPGVLPVVKLYGLAAARGRAAPLPFFVAGYLLVWSAMALPAYFAWKEFEMPVAEGQAWAARVAGGTLIAAAVWQLSPLKRVCLRHCRSPLSFFLRFGSKIARPAGALRMGAAHGLFCLGCCWALFAVLVALGTMNLAWMAVLTGLIVLEKHAPHGPRIAQAGALVLALLGTALLLDTSLLGDLT